MRINDVKRNIDELWDDAAASWQDEMSKKYKGAMLKQMENLLDSMQSTCSQLTLASEEALRQLKEIQK